MAKLSNLRKQDVRCIVREENGMVAKVFNQDVIAELNKNYDANSMISIYNPTTEQKEHIMTILDENNDGKEISVEGTTILRLMEIVTDIEFDDLDDEEALEIVNNPNEMLQAVNVELNKLLIEVVKQRYETMATLNTLPEPMLKEILAKKVEEAEAEEEKRREEEKRKAEREAKRKELEEQLAALGME